VQDNFGHLDFTLSLDDGIITHVLRQLSAAPAAATGSEGRAPAAASRRVQQGESEDEAEPDPRAVPYIHHEVLQPQQPRRNTPSAGAAQPGASSAAPQPPTRAYDAPPAAAPPAIVAHSSIAHEAFARLRDGYHGAWLAPRPTWLPARACVARYPWLAGFTKLDVVLDGLDAEAAEMGLAGPSALSAFAVTGAGLAPAEQ
jgi:hypothetical protein